MKGKGEDRAEGLAGQSVNASTSPPSQSSPDHQEQGDRTQSNRSLTGSKRHKDADPTRPQPEDRYKP